MIADPPGPVVSCELRHLCEQVHRLIVAGSMPAFGQKADTSLSPADVRFTPESGH